MRLEVLLTADARRDLEDLFEYIAVNDKPESAARVLDRIEQVLADLANFPDRGSHPRELLALGIREYRQVVLRPYRMIYRVSTPNALVYLIADDRRDMQTLLTERLIRPR
jgi:toxin ParE1/3/4